MICDLLTTVDLKDENDQHAKSSYCRNLQWMPDGSCLLALTDTKFIIHDLQYHSPEYTLPPSLIIPQSTPILDYKWYPHANSADPSTCCFVSSSKDQPIKLIDAYHGTTRATYSAYDDKDELIAPHSLAFTPSGISIVSGYEHYLRIFSLERPGREYVEVKTTPTRKSRVGQKGIVSALDVSEGLIAAGSFSKNVGVYDIRSGGECVWLEGLGFAVTQVKMVDGCLYVGGRNCDVVRVYDLRCTGQILAEIERKGQTNQRLHFDVCAGKMLTGDLEGTLRCFDIGQVESHKVETMVEVRNAHNDVISGAAFNPRHDTLVATCSGQRKFMTFEEDGEEQDGQETDQSESSLKLWSLIQS